MSVQEGKYLCDNCGRDVGNGGVYSALVVSDLDVETGMVINLHFCRAYVGEDGKKVKGCDSKIIKKTTVPDFLERNEMSTVYAQPQEPEPLPETPDPLENPPDVSTPEPEIAEPASEEPK